MKQTLTAFRLFGAGCGVFMMACWMPAGAADPLSLADCVRMGVEGNLTLQMQRIQLASASADVQAVSGVYDPRLNLNGSYMDSALPPGSFPAQGGMERGQALASLGREFSTGTRLALDFDVQRNLFEGMSAGNEPVWRTAAGLSVSQSLGRNAFGEADEARIDYVRQRIDSLALEYERSRERIVAAIKDEYWQAFTAREVAEARSAVLGRLARLLEINRQRFEDGLVDEAAVLAVEASLSVAEVEVEVLAHESVALDERLKERIHLPARMWDATRIDYRLPEQDELEEPVPGFAGVFEEAIKNRADREALEKEAQRTESLIRLRDSEDRGDIQLTGSFGRGDSDPDAGRAMDFDRTVWSVGIAVDLSLKRSVSRAALQQAFLDRERVRTQIEMLERSIELECRTAIRQVATARRLAAATRKSLELQTRKLELETKRYERGQSDIHTLLDYQNDLEAAERDYAKARGSLQRAHVALQLVQGVVPAGDPR